MRKSAIAASAVLATGLMGLGGTAFADSGAAADAGEDNTQPNTSEQQQPNHHVAADADPNRASLVGVNIPVAADLHEGVANNLHAHDVARDIAVVGDVVPAEQTAQDNTDDAQARSGGDTDEGQSTNVEANVNDETYAPEPEPAPEQDKQLLGKLGNADAVHGLVSETTSTVSEVTKVGGIELGGGEQR